MLGLLVTPIGLKPGPAAAFANEMKDFRRVIGQIELDRTKRLYNKGYLIRDLGIALAPGDVLLDVPAALGFGSVEKFLIQFEEAILELSVGGPFSHRHLL